MKRLIKKLLLVSIPIWPLLFAYLVFIIGGEYSTLQDVHEIQYKDKNSIYGLAYSNKDVEYKSYETLTRRPEVLALGTSRVMQFRENSFDLSFYNGGGLVASLPEVKIALEYLIENKYFPKIIILGLDQYFFNEYFDSMNGNNTKYKNRIRLNSSSYPDMISLAKDIVKKKINIATWNNSNIGINAKQNKNGFLYDGSYYYGNLVENGVEWDKDFSDTFERIRKGISRFEYCDDINPIAIDTIRDILKISYNHSIEIIAFLPPYAPSVYEEMVNTGQYDYIFKIAPVIKDEFKKYGFKFYDLTYIEGSNDDEFYDGFHGSTELYKEIAMTLYTEKK